MHSIGLSSSGYKQTVVFDCVDNYEKIKNPINIIILNKLKFVFDENREILSCNSIISKTNFH